MVLNWEKDETVRGRIRARIPGGFATVAPGAGPFAGRYHYEIVRSGVLIDSGYSMSQMGAMKVVETMVNRDRESAGKRMGGVAR